MKTTQIHRQLSRKPSPTNGKTWIWIGLAALPAIRLYYVQEMIAALILFSVLFLAVSMVVVVVFTLDRACQQIIVWAEAGIARMTHWVVGAIEGITARPV